LTKPKKYNVADTIARLKAKAEEDENTPIPDPYTVKIRKFPNELTENDLREAMIEFGEITRCKIPWDMERNENKGIGFVTFKSPEGTKAALAEGFMKYDVFEYPIE
jgi:RNA recognition motif-containing protein